MAAKNENAPPPSSTSHGSSSGDASGGGTSSDSVKSKSTSGGDFQVLYQQPQRPTSTSTSMTTSTLSVLEQKKSEKDAKEMKIRSMLNSVTEQEAALEIMKGLTEMATATRPQKRVSFRRQEISVIPEEYERSESSEPKVASQLQGDTPLEVRKFHDDDTVSEMTDSHTVTSSVFTVGSSVRSDKEIKRTPANESNVVIPKEEDWLPHDQPMFQIKRSATNDGIKRAALSNKGVEVESRRDGNLPREDSTITMDHDSCEYEYTAPLKQSSYSQSQSSSSHSSLVTGPQPASLSTEDTGPQPTGYYQMSSSDTSASPWKVSSSDTSASPWRDISSISDADGATAASVANSEDAIAASTMSVDTIETNYFTDTNTEGYSEAAVTTVSAVYSDAVSSYVHSDDAVVVSLQSIDTIATHPHVAPITIAPSTVTASKLVNAVAAAADTATGGDSQFAATSRPPLANSNDHQPSAAAAGDNTKAPRRTKMKKKKSSKKKVNTNLEGITTATTHLATVQTAPRGIGTDQQQQKLSASLIPLAATTPASHQKQRPPRHASKQNKAASDGAIMRRAQLEKARIRAQDENLARQAQSDPTMRYQSSEQFEFSRSGALGGGGDPMEPSSGFMSQTRFGSPHSSSASLHQSSHLRHGDYNSRRDVLAGNDYSTTGGGSGDTTVRRSHVGKKTLADEYKRAPASYPLTPNFSMGPPPPYLPHGDLEPGSIEDQIEEGSNDDGVGYFNLFAAEARTPKSTRSRIIFFAILCFLFVAGGGIAVAIIMTQSESTPDPPASAPTALPEEQAWSSDELLALLKREPAVDIQAVEFPGTPQAKAFTWLQNESNHEDGVLSDEKSVLQRFAFATLYYSTAGDNWVENTGWLSAAHECVWTTDIIWPCDLNREMLKLELVANALSGSLPGEIGLLSKLQVIHLSGNKKIEKEIPLSIWTLPNLTSLKLNDNEVSGSIPSDIKGLQSLETLNLDLNNLAGSIPTEIGLVTNLKELRMASNNLEGSIPVEIENLSMLTTVELEENSINGTIPEGIFRLPALGRISLSDNNFAPHALSPEIGTNRRLKSLEIENCGLIGNLPSEIGRLTELDTLRLRGNQLSGFIPSRMGDATGLVELDVSSNQLNGTLPSELGLLWRLEMLAVGNNMLSGEIPGELSEIKTYKAEFNFRGNNLTGSVPLELCQQSCCAMGDIAVDEDKVQGCVTDAACSGPPGCPEPVQSAAPP